MNARVHRPIGAAAGGAVVACFSEPTLENLLAGLVGGYVGAALPDIFEPATTPLHRSFFHSWSFATGCGFAIPTAIQELKAHAERQVVHHEFSRAMDPENAAWHTLVILFWKYIVQFVIGLVAGYASHLALDATTAQGLPVFVQGD